MLEKTKKTKESLQKKKKKKKKIAVEWIIRSDSKLTHLEAITRGNHGEMLQLRVHTYHGCREYGVSEGIGMEGNSSRA